MDGKIPAVRNRRVRKTLGMNIKKEKTDFRLLRDEAMMCGRVLSGLVERFAVRCRHHFCCGENVTSISASSPAARCMSKPTIRRFLSLISKGLY